MRVAFFKTARSRATLSRDRRRGGHTAPRRTQNPTDAMKARAFAKPSPEKCADDSDDETLESMKVHAFAKPSPEKCADDSS